MKFAQIVSLVVTLEFCSNRVLLVKTLILLVLLSLKSFAGLTEDFNQLKYSGQNFEPDGTICEEIARLRFQEKYPQPEYSVITGVEYSDGKTGVTIGELDLVVLNNQNHEAVAIGEVKCWKSPKGGFKKAKEQRQRFQTNMASKKSLSFAWLDHASVKLSKTQFDEVEQFFFVGPLGSKEFGFDYELDYSLEELSDLRRELLSCQTYGDCTKP